uniref:Uncharacterized protein n=1 Tax=Anguilla anguilla TaxID=7936 RepID=A0A0E9XRS8_ANGAN
MAEQWSLTERIGVLWQQMHLAVWVALTRQTQLIETGIIKWIWDNAAATFSHRNQTRANQSTLMRKRNSPDCGW